MIPKAQDLIILLKKKWIFVFSVLLISGAAMLQFRKMPDVTEEIRYFAVQNRVIQILIAQDFAHNHPTHPDGAFAGLSVCIVRNWNLNIGKQRSKTTESAFEALADELLHKYNVELRQDADSGFLALDRSTGKFLDIHERKNWTMIRCLLEEMNSLLETYGRLECEFDGGNNSYLPTPFTTILFNTAYLKYQSQRVGYHEGRYQLIDEDDQTPALNDRDLLIRNFIVRLIWARTLSRAASLLAERNPVADVPKSDAGYYLSSFTNELLLQGVYSKSARGIDKLMASDYEVTINWTDDDFKTTDRKTGKEIVFPRDDDLLQEALRQLNYYKEKCDFVNYFQVWNYPMYMLSILRLYDVNLELDEGTGRYVLAPGPTDPQKFFRIAAEFTFVNDESETEYLKQHLTSW